LIGGLWIWGSISGLDDPARLAFQDQTGQFAAGISNDDIGHISIGQKATVKLQTYDFVRFGALEGAVEQIAADAVMDRETGQMLFNVTIRTERSYLGATPSDQPVHLGMQAIVDLHIGKRSILSYLTDRLDRTTQSALRER